jgi:DNA polymerase-3 subunit delta
MKGLMAKKDPAMGELNTSVLDGRTLTLAELQHACDSVPFLSDRRLVIVHGLLARLSPRRKGKGPASSTPKQPGWKRSYLDGLAAYLPDLPSSARLVFVEAVPLPASHPILKLAKSQGSARGAHIKSYTLPKPGQLPGWIHRCARDKGGALSTEATAMLAALVGPDLRLLDSEIEKLLLYAEGRQVTTRDVSLLVSRASETKIFDLVDCIGLRETDKALRLLRRMLAERVEPMYLLAMLARQVRILMQVKELGARDLTEPEIAKKLALHPFVVKKGLAQSRRFSLEQLETAHQRLIDADLAIKTGEQEANLSLDLLVVSLTKV